MNRWALLLIILQAFTSSALASEESINLLYIQPQIAYQAPKIFTQGQTASYSGLNYAAALYYKIGDENFAWAPFASYEYGVYQNSANSAVRSEKITENTITAGAKFYFGNWFLTGSYSWVKFNAVTSGTSNLTVTDSGTGLGASLGHVFNLSSYVAVEVSGNIMNTNFQAKSGGFSNSAQYLRYGATLGLSILLPSTPPRRGYFKSNGSSIP